MAEKMPDRARIVVIGAGIVGASVAYHLSKLGERDVVLLEKDTLASGTTGHAAGLVTQLRPTRGLTDISRQAIKLYSELEAETGQDPGFRQTGSISVARTSGRLDELEHMTSMAKAFGVEMEPITIKEAGQMWPLMRTDDLAGAVYIPMDGQTVPDSTTMALVTGARNRGAVVVENTRVTGIKRRAGTVTGVATSRGDIQCEIVVNCAGMWARELGLLCGVSIPLHAADHAYLVTKPMEGVGPDLLSLRDPDGHIYFRSDIEGAGGLLMGGFELVAAPWGMDGIPDDFASGMLRRDWSPYMIFLEKAVERVPAMEDIEILRWLVGPESFTPDNNYIMGEAPELRNFYVAAGFNSSGIASAAGAGSALAEWIVQGEPTMDLSEVDIRRFHPFMNNSRYLHDRTVEGLGLIYDMHWPGRQPVTARPARRSALHDRLAGMGACFGVAAGWERPNWYAPEEVESVYEYSFARQNWFPHAAEEHRAVREAVGLFDQSSLAKFLLQGPDAESVLQNICANDVGVEPGTVVYTTMLNRRGGIEADLTVNRISEEEYLIVTGGATATRDSEWVRRNTPDGARATLTDMTSAYGVLGVMGPLSRQLLSSVTDADLSNDAFPFRASREIGIGYAPVIATRISYVGELGWELFVPTEFMLTAYEAVLSVGDAFGLRHAGYHAMESLRLEKGYRSWGHDITDQDTPLEAGLGFAVAFDKDPDFIGRDAMLREREKTLRRRLVTITLDDPEPYLLGNEPIYRDGTLVGHATSGQYGHTAGRSVGLGYIENEEGADPGFIRSGSYEVEVATERVRATASLRPPYDPLNLRVRG